MLEYILIAELMQEAWVNRREVIQVLHSKVDAFGYDVVLECQGVVRHVQLKSRKKDGRTNSYGINAALEGRTSGCVIWIGWEEPKDGGRLQLHYRWFGDRPGERLPAIGDTPMKHTRANAEGIKTERPNIKKVRLSRFTPVVGIPELFDLLFIHKT